MESQPQDPKFLSIVSPKILNSGIILKTFSHVYWLVLYYLCTSHLLRPPFIPEQVIYYRTTPFLPRTRSFTTTPFFPRARSFTTTPFLPRARECKQQSRNLSSFYTSFVSFQTEKMKQDIFRHHLIYSMNSEFRRWPIHLQMY